MIDRSQYPLLSREQEARWDGARVCFVFELDLPIPHLVGNVRMAAFSGDRVLVIDTMEFGPSAFPGGTLAPDEEWAEALERELLEEAGARVLSYQIAGRIRQRSEAKGPYRPHLPHPESQQVVGYGAVEIIGTPTNPAGGEHVLRVSRLPVDDAVALLREEDPWEAELLRLIADIRAVG